ncbi:MAG: lipid-A-disaccharide synthase, partial [Gemmatimonadaceae bacterium]
MNGEILIVAGEVSGDLHAGAVVEAIHQLQSERKFFGIGGSRMQAAGVELIEHVDNLAVMGFVEVVKEIPHHWKLLRTLR